MMGKHLACNWSEFLAYNLKETHDKNIKHINAYEPFIQ